MRSEFSLPNGSVGKNVFILRIGMSSSVHIDNKKKDVLVLGKGPTQELDDTKLLAEAHYSINFSRSNRKFWLRLHYIGSNRFLFINATKLYQFKAKDSKINKYPLCLGSIARDFSANNLIKTELNGCLCITFLLIIELLILVMLSMSINI